MRLSLTPRTLHKAIYKTPDYLLCSAQDFQPGQRSRGGQSWQATLGADAIVFVNHPGDGLRMAGCCHASPSIMIS